MSNPPCLRNVTECPDPIEIVLKGNLPNWLEGSFLLCSSPGLFDLPSESVNHWIDGYAILSKFALKSTTTILFSSRYLNSNAYKKAIKEGHPVAPEWGTPPGEDSSRGILQRMLPAFTPMDVTDNSVGRILRIGEKYYTMGYSCFFHEIDPISLEVMSTLDSWNAFGANSFTPEYVPDRNSSEVYVMGGALVPTLKYMPIKINCAVGNKPGSIFQVMPPIPPRWTFGGCGMRTCIALTDNFILFIEAPWVISLVKFAATFIQGYAMKNWLGWYPEEATRFCIVKKDTGEVIQTEIYNECPAFIVSSIINAYEEEGQIVLELFVYDDPECVEAMTVSKMRGSLVSEDYKGGSYHRYTLPLVQDVELVPDGASLLPTGGAYRDGNRIIVKPEVMLAERGTGFDTGTINPKFVGTKHRYIYFMSSLPSVIAEQYVTKGIGKIDLTDGKIADWPGLEGYVVSPPVFMPRKTDEKSVEEDDGVIVTLIAIKDQEMSRTDAPESMLVFLDAKTMQELSRAELPTELGAMWFHATFFEK